MVKRYVWNLYLSNFRKLFEFVDISLEHWLHCKFCEKRFRSEIQLVCHLQLEENYSESMKVCTVCHVAFYSAQEFQEHIVKNHPYNRSQCPICRMAVKHQCNFLRHVSSHFSEKPFNCRNCGNSFKRKDKLKDHERKCMKLQ